MSVRESRHWICVKKLHNIYYYGRRLTLVISVNGHTMWKGYHHSPGLISIYLGSAQHVFFVYTLPIRRHRSSLPLPSYCISSFKHFINLFFGVITNRQ